MEVMASVKISGQNIRYTPLPPIYWNHWISVKMTTDLFGSASCRQNLDVKELRGRSVGTSWLVPTVTASTMIARMRRRGQGWMSQRSVDFGRSPDRRLGLVGRIRKSAGGTVGRVAGEEPHVSQRTQEMGHPAEV